MGLVSPSINGTVEIQMNSNLSFDYPMTIREGHLDTFDHVNNAVYLQLLEEARWEVATNRGYGLARVRETLQGPTILEIKLTFMRELKLRQKIIIRTQLLSHEGKISVLSQRILDEQGQICCEAKFTLGFFDLKARKLIPPTAEWMQALGAASGPT